MYAQQQRFPTVAGVPLAQGERVLYFQQADLGSTRIVFVILGILFLIIVVGLYCFYRVIVFDSKEEHFYVITNYRVFTVNKKGRVMKQIEVAKIWRVKQVVGGKDNRFEVSAGVINDEISFRASEIPDFTKLKPVLNAIRDPDAVAQLPGVPFPN